MPEIGQYRLTAPTLADGELSPLQLDGSGNLRTASGGSGTTADQVQGNVAAASADSGNPVKVGGVYSSTLPTLTNGQRGNLQLNAKGAVYTSIVDGGGFPVAVSNGASDGQAAASTALSVANYALVFNGTTWDRQRGDTTGTYVVPRPATSGGLSVVRLVAATSGVIKASAGQLYTGVFTNTNAAIRFLQIYDKATAGTLSTDTPVVTIPLPPNTSVCIDFSNLGGAFATGISWQFTTDDIAIPTTAGASTDIHGYCTYK